MRQPKRVGKKRPKPRAFTHAELVQSYAPKLKAQLALAVKDDPTAHHVGFVWDLQDELAPAELRGTGSMVVGVLPLADIRGILAPIAAQTEARGLVVSAAPPRMLGLLGSAAPGELIVSVIHAKTVSVHALEIALLTT